MKLCYKLVQSFFALKLSDKAFDAPIGLPKNAILCMILLITLDVNRKRVDKNCHP